MYSGKLQQWTLCLGLTALLIGAAFGVVAAAEANKTLRIPVGHAEVVVSNDDVRTVAIAEPKIADAAVGSQKTVVVNGKSEGVTTLVVYNEGARFQVYEVEVYVPNGEKQVALHATVSELSKKAAKQIGFDLTGEVTNTVPWLDGSLGGGFLTDKAGSSRDGFLRYIRTKGDVGIAADWHALIESGDIRQLANPTVVARSGQQATFLVGGQFPVPVATGGGASVGGTVVQSVTIEWKEFGIRLIVTPTIQADGSITLELLAEVSDLDFSTALRLSGFDVPVVNMRKATTTVNLRPGEYLAIGGMKGHQSSKTVRRVPVLGYIPLLGVFFSSHETEKVERDVMIVVSPELIATSASMLRVPTDQPETK